MLQLSEVNVRAIPTGNFRSKVGANFGAWRATNFVKIKQGPKIRLAMSEIGYLVGFLCGVGFCVLNEVDVVDAAVL